MAGAMAARLATVENASQRLYDAIGAFLAEHRLSPDPHHYAFAHRIVSEPGGTLARSVAALTEGGFRLSARDIEALGGEIGALAVADPAAARPTAADALVAQTQLQVEGFTDMVAAMRAEAQGFGRDLAASASAIRDSDALGVSEVIRLTGAMLDRVQAAEERLEQATHEASELRAKLEEARDDARRDPLTDLPNRRAFEEAFAAQAVPGAALCMALCDIDHFKRVNDAFGHVVGDRVLKTIADALDTGCAGHVVARYGGEEFAILFTGVDRAGAAATLDAVRAAVATKRYRVRETDTPLGCITFSAGVTQVAPDEPLGTVFGRADRLLYAAKNAGRNQLYAG